MDVRGDLMCLEAGVHLFVSISENFFGASNQANCTDEAQHKNLGSIRGNFDLEVSLSTARWWLGSYD